MQDSTTAATPRAAIARTADLNWRWRRTLVAIAEHIDRGNAFLSEGLGGEAWPFARRVIREHCNALLMLGYLTYTTSKTGHRRYALNPERFADLEREARLLGRLS